MSKENNITITHPLIALEWDYEKNNGLLPTDVSKGQQIKVFWKCKKGHSYSARVDHRCSMSSGCPYCSRVKALKGETDLATLFPEIAVEWDYNKNTGKPDEYLPQSNKSVFWICPICHMSYERIIQQRTVNGFGCPQCLIESHTSVQEQAIAYYFEKITTVESRVKKYGKEIDVFLPYYNIGIEFNGEYYHSKKAEKDRKKYDALKSKGIRLIVIQCGRERFIENDVITIKTKRDANPTDHELKWGIENALRLSGLSFDFDIDIKTDKSKIYSRYIKTQKANNLQKLYPVIASEWNYKLNNNLSPTMFTSGSHKTVWWTCSKCGNDYQMKIYGRTTGKMGCPYCAGKRIKPGFNDLATTHPELLEEWDYTKNVVKPSEVSFGSENEIWWICKKCGYNWPAVLYSRTNGCGCPVCAGKVVVKGKNDLETLNPEVTALWNYEKNTSLPSEYTLHSNARVWWACPECKHHWFASINALSRGRRCPKCAKAKRVANRLNSLVSKKGSLADNNPELLNEWDFEANKDFSPNMLSSGSHKEVNWICKTCGNKWKSKIYLRTIEKHGCPQCGAKKSSSKRRKQVRNVETGQIFDFSSDAADTVGVTRSAIQFACKNKTLCKGYHWEYVDQS